jgi:hypothetical protein
LISARTRRAVALAVLFALPVSAASAPHRQILSVDLRAGESPALVITTDGPPNFTSFRLDHPARVVVDFPETTAQPADGKGPEEGPIARWLLQPLDSADRTDARLTVELRADADYTIASNGKTVELRLRRATSRPLVALEGDRPGAANTAPRSDAVIVATAEAPDAGSAAVAPAPAAPEAVVAQAGTPAPPDVSPPPPPAPPEMSPAEKARAERAAREAARLEALRQKQEEARAKAEAKKQAQLQAAAAAKAAHQEKLRRQREAVAAAAAARAEKLRLQREAAARVAAARAEKLREAREAAAARKAEQAEKLRRQREAATAARATREKKAREALAARKAERARKEQVRKEALAAALAAQRERAARKREALARIQALHPATLGQIGFHRSADGAEVLLHTSAPVHYTVREEAPDRIVVALERTRILVANNRRPLDTRFFGTSVARIAPIENPAALSVDVEIDLTTPVPCEIKANGASLTVVFHGLASVRADAQSGTGLTAEP